MFYVYVLNNLQGLLYKGVTENLEERVKEHNNNTTRWTGKREPWKLVYFEEYGDKTEAYRRERFFKSGKGREYLKTKLAN